MVDQNQTTHYQWPTRWRSNIEITDWSRLCEIDWQSMMGMITMMMAVMKVVGILDDEDNDDRDD